MVTLGGDCHKRTHTLVAVDDNGRELGTKTVAAVAAGHLEALRWASQWKERRWALENCRHLSRRLEADLLECREYLETEMDVVDGDYGVPAPNRAMVLVTMIDQSLNGGF